MASEIERKYPSGQEYFGEWDVRHWQSLAEDQDGHNTDCGMNWNTVRRMLNTIEHQAATIERLTASPSDDEVERVAVIWLARSADADEDWARQLLEACRGEAHYGDCTKAPMTCNRCLCDEALEFARAAIAALRGQP